MHLVRAALPADAPAIAAINKQTWGGDVVVAHGVTYHLTTLPTLVALRGDGTVAGVASYAVAGEELELVSIAAVPIRGGAGTALLKAVADLARQLGLRRVWLVTTNDNLDALRFYQRRGMRIAGVDRGAVDRARALKPGIPTVGGYGIEMHDELILELAPEPARETARETARTARETARG